MSSGNYGKKASLKSHLNYCSYKTSRNMDIFFNNQCHSFLLERFGKCSPFCIDRCYVHHYQSNIELCQNCLQSVDTGKIHSYLCLRNASKWKSTYIINNQSLAILFLCIFVFTQFLWNVSWKSKCISKCVLRNFFNLLRK